MYSSVFFDLSYWIIDIMMTLVALEKIPCPSPSMPAPPTSFGQNDFQERGIDVLLGGKNGREARIWVWSACMILYKELARNRVTGVKPREQLLRLKSCPALHAWSFWPKLQRRPKGWLRPSWRKRHFCEYRERSLARLWRLQFVQELFFSIGIKRISLLCGGI